MSADLPGIVDRIGFDSGKAVKQGDVLVELDTRQEQAQLAAAEAQVELSRVTFERMKNLVGHDAVSRAEVDAAAAANKQAEARIREIRATIERKTIHAPFSGMLGIRAVNLGQYLNGGDAVVSLQSLNPIYVNFGIPQQDAGQMHLGRGVRITVADLGNVSLDGPDHRARFGGRRNHAKRHGAGDAGESRRKAASRHVRADASALGASQSVIALPGSSINYAPYGDSVYVVADLKDPNGKPYRGVRQQVVKLGGSRGDQIAVLGGIKPGEEIVTSGVFKLRNGAAVQINNKVKPANNRAPKPEDS